jgi:hypothetical protein
MRRIRSLDVAYNYFEPGALVTPSSPCSMLKLGQTYKVTKCTEPQYVGEYASCYVQGEEYPVSAEHLMEVTPQTEGVS